MSFKLSPSILSADFANLQKDVEVVNASEADWFHVDVMDGLFVPNISFGFPVISAVKKHASKPLDVHLMIADPDRYLQEFADAGADIISVHYEACTHLQRTITRIKSLGMKASVALNPHSSVSLLDDVLADLDMVLIMSVNPGYAAQSFIEHTYTKVKALKAIINDRKLNTLIEVDGGVKLDNAAKLLNAGADVLVAGSAVFNTPDVTQTIRKFKEVKPGTIV